MDGEREQRDLTDFTLHLVIFLPGIPSRPGIPIKIATKVRLKELFEFINLIQFVQLANRFFHMSAKGRRRYCRLKAIFCSACQNLCVGDLVDIANYNNVFIVHCTTMSL